MKAWELLSKPGAWCQGTCARNASGDICGANNPDAVAWCLFGSILKCYRRDTLADYPPEYAILIRELYKKFAPARFVGVGTYNDDPARTQEEVVALLKDLDL